VAGTATYYAVVNAHKGGLCRVFSKQRERLVYEDAGYVVRAAKKRWSSQFIGLGQVERTAAPNEIACSTTLAAFQQDLPTPAKFLLLRLLNLTLFRSLALGKKLRELIIRRLITTRRPGPLTLLRYVSFGPNQIQFRDRLKRMDKVWIEAINLSRSLTAVHMGSAKYFQASELEAVVQPNLAGLAGELNRSGEATCEFVVHLPVCDSPGNAS